MPNNIFTSLRTPIQSTVSLGTTAVTLSDEKNNTRRVELAITNISTAGQAITIAFGQNAVANAGIVLAAGQSYVASATDGFEVTQLFISAVASAAGASLAFFERSV